MSDLNSNFAAAPSATLSPMVANIREEARAAILAEQLSYLLDHNGQCPAGCPDCARMKRVEEALLQPFRVKVYAPLAGSPDVRLVRHG